MEKKQYNAPEMEVLDIELTSMIAMSFQDGEVDTDYDQLSNRYGRRGTWGNLWYDED